MEKGHTLYTLYLDTCLGLLVLRGSGKAVTELTVAEEAGTDNPDALLEDAARQVLRFLAGKQRELTFPIEPEGTEFQKQVWQALREIPYGHTDTYGGLAARIGRPKACRAVGSAAGKNPILLAIPCHRLLASDGLGGFSCGLERKKVLLELEGRACGIDN